MSELFNYTNQRLKSKSPDRDEMFVAPTFRSGLETKHKKVSHDVNLIEEKHLYATQQTPIFDEFTSVSYPNEEDKKNESPDRNKIYVVSLPNYW